MTLIGVPCTTQAFGYEWAEQYLLTMFAAHVSFPERISPVLIPQSTTKRCESDFVEGYINLVDIIEPTSPYG